MAEVMGCVCRVNKAESKVERWATNLDVSAASVRHLKRTGYAQIGMTETSPKQFSKPQMHSAVL